MIVLYSIAASSLLQKPSIIMCILYYLYIFVICHLQVVVFAVVCHLLQVAVVLNQVLPGRWRLFEDLRNDLRNVFSFRHCSLKNAFQKKKKKKPWLHTTSCCYLKEEGCVLGSNRGVAPLARRAGEFVSLLAIGYYFWKGNAHKLTQRR